MELDRENNQSRWQQMEEIYHAALPLPFIERHAFVAQYCAGDAALQEEVISLLVADDGVADFLKEPVAEVGLAILADENLLDTQPMSYPTQPATGDLVGTIVAGRYEVLKRLSGGGFGDVYKAADIKIMSRPVVVKVLKDDALREEGAKRDWVRKKFKQEMEVLAKIADPGVVRIFDADTLPDSRPYIVMEFVEGPNLGDFIKQFKREQVTEQGLNFSDVAEIVKQVGRTLTAVHAADIFHRDLKPENIMLPRNKSGDLQAKVIDFGIARVRNSLVAPTTATGLFVAGTWPYMSPEQLQGKKVGAACDIYALGVIAYEMVTGRYPFPAKDPAQLKEMQEAGIKVKPCDLNPELPHTAQEAILKAISYYPAERHSSAREFGDELSSALAYEQDLVRPVLQPADAPTSGSWLRLHRNWVFAASALLLAGIIGVALWRAFSATEQQQLHQQPTTTTPNAGPERTLTYWLSMKRPRDAVPFDSIGAKVVEPGSEFWFNVQTTRDGALYLFGEGHDRNGPSETNTMFPTLKSGNGDARLGANRTGPVTKGSYKFKGDNGVIYLWIIWAAQPIPLLDEIVGRSYDTGGTIRDPTQLAALRAFVEQHRTPKPGIVEDEIGFRVTLKGRDAVLVDVRKLEYQP
ncbi:MAG: eukaryotic-like serine/threonine-protein kinase [Acidobacteriota bacterium]|jgi:serine/threonine protein kinase|nr:eukaryotic-like serine/threonine-protein kinase [Acidobacteriota bacterium]